MKIDWNEKSDGIDIKLLQEFMKRSVTNKATAKPLMEYRPPKILACRPCAPNVNILVNGWRGSKVWHRSIIQKGEVMHAINWLELKPQQTDLDCIKQVFSPGDLLGGKGS